MRTLFTSCFVMAFMLATAQRDKLETVTIGIDQKSLSAVEWPFDVPFYLAGKIEADVQSVQFNYRIADHGKRRKKWISFPDPRNSNIVTNNAIAALDGYLTIPKIWKPGSGDNSQFIFLCEGLHPNIKYNFRFELIRKVSLDAALVTEMKTKLANKLLAFFKSKESTQITTTDLNTENANLKSIVLSYFPGKDLRFKSSTDKTFDFDAFDIAHAAAVPAYVASHGLYTAQANYGGAVAPFLASFNAIRGQILNDIDAIQSGNVTLNPYSKEVLALPFNPGLPDFKAYTLSDGIKLLRQMSLPLNNDLKEVLEGRMKISNNSFTATNGQHDIQSILFIASLLDALGKQQAVKTIIGKTEMIRFGYFPNTMKSDIVTIRDEMQKTGDLRKMLSGVVDKIPDILSLIVQFEAIESEVLPLVDVLSENTPYISAEAGISYIQAFQSLARYQGANIYFTPVNKKAPLSSFRGTNRLLKMLCLHIGVSNMFGDRPGNSRSLLGKGSESDLNVGVGLRINRIIKLNAGILPYKTNQHNELGDDYKLKTAGYFSIGIDVNLLKAFGDVATLLKL